MSDRERLEMRVSEEWLARLDRARGDVARATFVKRLVDGALGGVSEPPVVVSGREEPALEVTPRSTRTVDVTAARRADVRGAHLPTCRCPVCKPPK